MRTLQVVELIRLLAEFWIAHKRLGVIANRLSCGSQLLFSRCEDLGGATIGLCLLHQVLELDAAMEIADVDDFNIFMPRCPRGDDTWNRAQMRLTFPESVHGEGGHLDFLAGRLIPQGAQPSRNFALRSLEDIDHPLSDIPDAPNSVLAL